MEMWRLCLVALIIYGDTFSWCIPSHTGRPLMLSQLQQKLQLIDCTSRIFCNSKVKVVNVYFENETLLSNPGEILKMLNDCGISHISLRSKFRTAPMEIIKDDGIDMHLIMVLRDISQSVSLNVLNKKSASKHLTFVTLMVENPASLTKWWLQSVFESFWKRWILNVAIIYYRAGKLHIYRYDPFACSLSQKRTVDGHHMLTIRDIFPKTILNMRRKPLRICMYSDDIRSIFSKGEEVMGSDGLMLNYLVKSLNATRVINRVKPYGNISISSDICFKEIVEEIDDIALNTRFLSLESFYKRVEHTIVHNRDDLCGMVPKAQIASSFLNLFLSFNTGVWLSILATLLIGCGFCIFNYSNICSSSKFVLQLYASLMSMPFLKVHRPTSLRVFFCFWLIYGMLISVAFKGNLTGNLVERKYLPDINTLKDLALSPYRLATLPRHFKHLNRYIDTENVYGAILLEKLVEVPDLQMKHLIESNNLSFAYLQKYHISVFRANSRMHTKQGRAVFHAMQQCIVPFQAVYIVPYGSPYLGFINTLVRYAQEFGFINHWDHLMNAALRGSNRSMQRRRHNKDGQPIVLTLQHFQAVFSFLFIGLLASTTYFLFELLRHKH